MAQTEMGKEERRIRVTLQLREQGTAQVIKVVHVGPSLLNELNDRRNRKRQEAAILPLARSFSPSNHTAAPPVAPRARPASEEGRKTEKAAAFKRAQESKRRGGRRSIMTRAQVCRWKAIVLNMLNQKNRER